MAKGNDGNLLQHACELAAMRALVRTGVSKAFQLYCTHAMAPREAFGAGSTSAGGAQLRRALNLAAASNSPLPPGTRLDSSPLVEAYAAVQASDTSYPNTAVLLQGEASRLGVELTATLVDRDPVNARGLRLPFAAPQFQVLQGDWREHLSSLRVPKSPWLLTMDPYTFADKASAANLDASDLRQVASVVERFVRRSEFPGVVSVFCYGLNAAARSLFFDAVAESFGQYACDFLGVQGTRAGERHVAALACSQARCCPRC